MPDLQEIMSVDDGFKGVISRLDPNQVPAQYVSQAINRVFQDQLIRNRWGIVQPKWGGKWTTATRTVTVTSLNRRQHEGTACSGREENPGDASAGSWGGPPSAGIL